MRNATIRRSGIAQRTGITISSPAVFYRCHEGSGSTISDALGHGPALSIAAGTPLTSDGYFSPAAANSTIYAQCTVAADSAGYLQSLLRMDTAYENILIGWDMIMGTDIAAIQNILAFGRSGVSGNFWIEMASTEQMQLVYGGENRSANSTIALGCDMTGLSTRQALMLDVHRTGTTTFDVSIYLNGTLTASGSGDWAANSGTAPLGANFGDGYILGARNGSTVGGAKSNYLNTDAGNGAKVGNIFMGRLNTAYAGIGQAVANDLYRYAGEIPRSLAGK